MIPGPASGRWDAWLGTDTDAAVAERIRADGGRACQSTVRERRHGLGIPAYYGQRRPWTAEEWAELQAAPDIAAWCAAHGRAYAYAVEALKCGGPVARAAKAREKAGRARRRAMTDDVRREVWRTVEEVTT